MRIRYFCHSCVALAAIGLPLVSDGANADIVIGAAGPLTGSRAWSGEQFRRGAELAVAELNAAGGVLGERLKLVVGDDAADPEQAESLARKLVRDGVTFVAGHRLSDASIAASRVYAEAGVLQISPSSTNPQLTEMGLRNVFRVCGRDDRQGIVAGDYLADHLSEKRIAILHDESRYGSDLAQWTKRQLNARGIGEVLYAGYDSSTLDLIDLVEQLRQAQADVLYLGGYSTDAALITRQAHDLGHPLQIVSGDALHNTDFWMITGAAGEGALFTFGSDPRDHPAAQAITARFREQGYEPEGYTLHTYAAVQVWASAVAAAGTLELDAVIAKLREREFDTVLGRIGFDAKGDLREHDFVWYVWRDSQYVRLK